MSTTTLVIRRRMVSRRFTVTGHARYVVTRAKLSQLRLPVLRAMVGFLILLSIYLSVVHLQTAVVTLPGIRAAARSARSTTVPSG